MSTSATTIVDAREAHSFRRFHLAAPSTLTFRSLCTNRRSWFIDCPPRSITSVGATQGVNPEVAAPFSSGGFSNIFVRPQYQSSAVSTYLSHHLPASLNTNLFERRGRAYPDVAAQGTNLQFTLAGKLTRASGTSASSPIFASVIALINDARLQRKLSPLGFLNPMLYKYGAGVLNDITRGSNPGCGTTGFPAAPGWDPVR